MLNDFYVTITGLYNRQCSIYMLGGPNDLNLLACNLLENTLIGV